MGMYRARLFFYLSLLLSEPRDMSSRRVPEPPEKTKTMHSVPPIFSILGYWAIVLSILRVKVHSLGFEGWQTP